MGCAVDRGERIDVGGRTDGAAATVRVCRVAVVARELTTYLAAVQSVDHQQFARLIPPSDHRKLIIITRYGCDLDAVLPQRRDQSVDCVPPRLGGAIFGFPIANSVDVDGGGIGELLLRQAGEYSGGAQVTTVMETIDFGSGRVAH
jgi:hypothetical protein